MEDSETNCSHDHEPQEIAARLRIERRGRYWAVYDQDVLVCVTVYKRGASEVVRRLRLQT